MNGFRGQLRRSQDFTPTKSSWERPPPDFQQAQRSKYERSQLSYNPSQSIRSEAKRHLETQQPRAEEEGRFNAVIGKEISTTPIQELQLKKEVQALLHQSKQDLPKTKIRISISLRKFLWRFVVRETQFMALKNEQKLKVDYSGFAEMVEDHFRLCQNEGESEGDIKKGGEGILSVLESNKYKESVHLYLMVRLANDEQVKDHLSHRLLLSEALVEKLALQSSHLHDQLMSRTASLEAMKMEAREQQQLLRRELEGFKGDQQMRTNIAKQKAMETEQQIRKQLENQRKEAVQLRDLELVEVKNKLTEAQEGWSQTKQRLFTLQGSERELKTQLAVREKEIASYTLQLEEAKKSVKELQSLRFTQQRTMTELGCKVEGLRSQLEDKRAIIQTHTELKENTTGQLEALLEQHKETKKLMEKTTLKLQEAQVENGKLQVALRELNEKYDRKKDKLVERNDVIKEQEKEVNELRRTIDDGRRRESTLLHDRDELAVQLADRETKTKAKQMQLEQCEKQLQDVNNLVVLLQRQINEKTAFRNPYGSTTGFSAGGCQQAMAPSYMGSTTAPSYMGSTTAPSYMGSTTTLSSSVASSTPGQRRMQPLIKRYGEEREKSPMGLKSPLGHKSPLDSRDKSPVGECLSQQKEPEEENVAEMKPRPIRFRNSKTTTE